MENNQLMHENKTVLGKINLSQSEVPMFKVVTADATNKIPKSVISHLSLTICLICGCGVMLYFKLALNIFHNIIQKCNKKCESRSDVIERGSEYHESTPLPKRIFGQYGPHQICHFLKTIYNNKNRVHPSQCLWQPKQEIHGQIILDIFNQGQVVACTTHCFTSDPQMLGKQSIVSQIDQRLILTRANKIPLPN